MRRTPSGAQDQAVGRDRQRAIGTLGSWGLWGWSDGHGGVRPVEAPGRHFGIPRARGDSHLGHLDGWKIPCEKIYQFHWQVRGRERMKTWKPNMVITSWKSSSKPPFSAFIFNVKDIIWRLHYLIRVKAVSCPWYDPTMVWGDRHVLDGTR